MVFFTKKNFSTDDLERENDCPHLIYFINWIKLQLEQTTGYLISVISQNCIACYINCRLLFCD